MISRRLFNATLASIFTLPALKNLPKPILDQKQTKLLRLKAEHSTQKEHFLTLEYPLNKDFIRELKFIGRELKFIGNINNAPIIFRTVHSSKLHTVNTYTSAWMDSFKIFNCDTKEVIMPNEISLGEYYDIKIYDPFGDVSYSFNNYFFKSCGDYEYHVENS